MTLEEYAGLVAEMRHAQVDFFRHAQSDDRLRKAKALEARVDKATREILEGQRVLFPAPDDRGPTKPAA